MKVLKPSKPAKAGRAPRRKMVGIWLDGALYRRLTKASRKHNARGSRSAFVFEAVVEKLARTEGSRAEKAEQDDATRSPSS